LYDVAVKPGSAPAERYMLFIKGAEKAVAGGDVMLAMQGIDQLALDFEADPLEMKEKLLEKFVSVGKPDQVAKAIPVAEQLMDQAEAADEFEIAIVLATTAGKAAAKGQIATRKETEDRLALRRHNLRMMMPMYTAATKAEETLAKDPADPEANLKAGRWRCLFKNDWAGGVPLLAKGSDEKLKVVAEQELKAPTEAEKQVELADAWWELGKNEGGTPRDSLRAHAADIYRAALPNLTSALKKAGIEKRLAEMTTAPHPAPPPRLAPPSVAKKTAIYLADLPAEELRVLPQGEKEPRFQFKGKSSPHSLWGHPTQTDPPFSHRAYRLDGRYRTFNGEVGIGGANNVSATALTFRIVGDGKTLWQSEPMQTSGVAVPFRVNVVTVKKLELFVDCPGSYDFAWAWWLDPVLEPLAATTGASNPNASAKPTAGSKFPIGQWVDVLRLVDPARDSVKGQWTRTNDGITSGTTETPRIAIPVTIEGSYDFEVEFIRLLDNGDVACIFSIGSHSCFASLSALAGEVSGLFDVDGVDAGDPRNHFAVRPGRLENNRRYQMLLSVRSLSADHATVDLSLDGKPYLPHWEGNPASLSVNHHWGLESPRGLALCGNTLTFHSARLRLLSGHAGVSQSPTQ
jgi:hypothetical protein